MLILGIDPGSIKLGYALLRKKGKQVEYICSGVKKFDQKIDFYQRLETIFDFCVSLKEKLNPDIISLESLVYIKNPNSLAKLAQARGAIICGLSNGKKVHFAEYSPNLVKSTISGHGHSDKLSIEKSIRMIFSKDLRDYEFSTDDESDAIAIALCHALGNGTQTKVQKGSKGRSMAAQLAHKC